MRVVEVTYSWPAETFIVRHAFALHESPYPVDLTIASKNPAQPLSASVNESGPVPFQVVSLPNFDYLGRLGKLREAAKTIGYREPQGTWYVRDKTIFRALSVLKPNLVHFHFGSLAVMLARYSRALDIPYTVSLRGSDIQVMPLSDPGYRESLGQALQAAAGVHAVCDQLSEQARSLCPNMPPATTIRTCVPIPSSAAAPYEGQSPIRLISVGRLHWTKAFHDLIRAVAFAPGIELDIVGEGPEREHLCYLIEQLGLSSRVRLIGSIPYEHFAPLMADAAAFVQPSITEGFSNALAEAMALGKPVFATPVGGTREVIIDRVNGILLPVGDAPGIARCLSLASDPELMSRLGSAARATAEQEFSAPKHAQAFWDFYQAALTRR